MQSLGKVWGIALLLVAALPAWAVDWANAQTVTVVTSGLVSVKVPSVSVAPRGAPAVS